MEEERDIVTLTDDEGNELELDVIDYFFCDGQEYAVLTRLDEDEEHECDCEECGDDCDCSGHEQELFIMKVVTLEDDMEEFVPVEDEMMEKLIAVVEKRFGEDDDEEEEDGDKA